jgi:peptide/nickel transport system ATP-binding protein
MSSIRSSAATVTAPVAPVIKATAPAIVDVRHLTKRFTKSLDIAGRIAASLGAGPGPETVHAVDGVDLRIQAGEVVGLVGESGCGKSTLGRMIAGILAPTAGQVMFKGQDRAMLKDQDARAARLAVQMIFQDPSASLNPRTRVDASIGEAPRVHGLVSRRDEDAYVADILQQVGLDPSLRRRFPHQFSGGQRARIGIARALAVKPEFLVCDEAIAALDVSIQAQVINLFMDLRQRLGLTYLFISHDLGVVQHIADRVVIMYLGRIVESAPTDDLFRQPNHPYAQALLAEIPKLSTTKRTFHPVKGEIPSPLQPPTGCHFHPRCPHATARCAVEVPRLREIAPAHVSACHLNDG